MDEHPDSRATGRADDDAALRLLRLAGPREPVPPDRTARVRAAVHDRWRKEVTAHRRRRLWVAAPLAAAALVAFAFAILRLLPGATAAQAGVVEVVRGRVVVSVDGRVLDAAPGLPVVAGAVVETDRSGRVALRLAGGTSLRIDTTSTVVLAASDDVRLERGALYVDSHGAASGAGLVVATAFGEVREVGTQFEVRESAAGLRVRVREGTVSLQRRPSADTVAAGQQATLTAGGVVTVEPVAATDPGWSWVLRVAPPFRLEGRSVADFLAWVARETGLEIRWSDPGLASDAEKIVVHGDIADLRPDQAPAAVLPTCGLTARVDKGTLIIATMAR